ncbi:hypothetical protein [Antribacter gilvus]|uniref:hypothetical protein n=1 Tax=Antribacter gilvus TaxID=2304675 RepID=UPI000F79DE62|nr:hypothetical protein [Antribacter gilvus]
MSIFPLALLALVLLLAVLTVVLVAAMRVGPPETDLATVRAARRHETLVSLGAAASSLAVGIAMLTAPVAWSSFGPGLSAPGVTQAVAPFAAAATFAAARGLGELRFPRPRGAVRTASLARRTIIGLGGWRLWTFAGTAALGAVALVVFGLTAAPDGRSVEQPVILLPDGGYTTGASGPYPGWPYGLPMLAVLAVAVVGTLLALRAVTRRTPLTGVPTPHDDALRRTSAARVLAGAQVWTGGGLGVLLLFTGLRLLAAQWPVAAAVCAILGLAVSLGSVVVAAPALLARRAAADAAVGSAGGGTGPRPATGGASA